MGYRGSIPCYTLPFYALRVANPWPAGADHRGNDIFHSKDPLGSPMKYAPVHMKPAPDSKQEEKQKEDKREAAPGDRLLVSPVIRQTLNG
jgi:hypothetical protein